MRCRIDMSVRRIEQYQEKFDAPSKSLNSNNIIPSPTVGVGREKSTDVCLIH